MKLRIFEILLIAVTLLFMCFTAGFFAGKDRTGPAVTIETQHSPEYSPDNSLATSDEKGEALPKETSGIEKININTAGANDLQTLPGIGGVLAERIIEYRNIHGDFAEIYDITNVSGIGEATFEKIEDNITV